MGPGLWCDLTMYTGGVTMDSNNAPMRVKSGGTQSRVAPSRAVWPGRRRSPPSASQHRFCCIGRAAHPVTLGDACKLPGNSCGNVFVKGYASRDVHQHYTKSIYLYNQRLHGPLADVTGTVNLIIAAKCHRARRSTAR